MIGQKKYTGRDCEIDTYGMRNGKPLCGECWEKTARDRLRCPCCGGNDVGEKGPYYARHKMRHYAYGCHTCGVLALTMVSADEAKKRFTIRAD